MFDDDYQDDDEYMREMAAFYDDEAKPTDKQLKASRNRWEKDFIRAKRLVWACVDDVWGLKLKHVDSVDFEI